MFVHEVFLELPFEHLAICEQSDVLGDGSRFPVVSRRSGSSHELVVWFWSICELGG